MPALLKRSNGYYYAILTDTFGHRKWISTKQRIYRSALKKLVQMGGEQEEKIPRTMLQAFYDDFKAYAGKFSSTQRQLTSG